MDIFEQTMHLDPTYDYLTAFCDKAYSGFWTPAKYKRKIATVDVPEIKNKLPQLDRQAIERCILAVLLVEDKVKLYWPNIHKDFPQTVIGDVGGLFGGMEVTHRISYSSLATELGVDIEQAKKTKQLNSRIKYLNKHLEEDPKIIGDKRRLKRLILFTTLVERCSLFTQFYILMSYAKRNRGLQNVAALQQTTATEECYAEGTEILTPEGWKDILSIKKGELVYQYNDGILESVPTTSVIAKDYSGDMIRFSSSNTECLVTPNHDMVYFTPKSGNKIIRKAKEFPDNTRIYIPYFGTLEDKKYREFSPLDQLRIAIQADGSASYFDNGNGKKPRGGTRGQEYSIKLKKPRKIERLRKILESIPNLEYREREDSSKPGYFVFIVYCDPGLKEFSSWIELDKVDSSWCKHFVSELKHWDGFLDEGIASVISNYSSTNEKNVDIAQTIGILAGYKTYKVKKIDTRSDAFSDSWKLSFRELKTKTTYAHLKKELVPFSGRVGCVSVPSGIIVTRFNDKTFIGGNCLHYLFGLELVKIVRSQKPQLWDDYLIELVDKNLKDAYKAELKLIDWFFEAGVPEHLTKEEVVNFLNYNFSQVSSDMDLPTQYKYDKEMFEKDNAWFILKCSTMSEPDFFVSPVGGYSSTDEDSFDDVFGV